MNAMMRTNLHPTSTPPEDQQPPRKKIRKGTRSCWECKHRKVRCLFVSDGDQSCRECLARGTLCRSQDLPEPENTRESDRASLSDRLGRVESLLERVLRRLDTLGAVEEARVLPSMATDNDDGLTCSAAATPANENAPAMSLFDNGVRSGNETPNPSHMDLLCRIAGSIIERNQRFSTITPSMVRTTQTIDAELMSIGPLSVVEDPTILPPGKSIERAQGYTKLMTQLWHYQLIAWLHLPLLLGSGTERRYDYSRQSCLEASRHMIICYTSLRRLTANSFCCKSLDFQAFTAAVTLLINIIGPTGRSHLDSNDWPAIEIVMTSLETLAEGQPPDKVATRSLSVLQTLKRVATRNKTTRSDTSDGLSPMDGQPGRIKLDIPYFGTISLDCSTRSDLPEQQQLNNGPPNPSSTDLAANNALSSNVGNTTEASTMHDQATDAGSWPEARLELGPADIWSFDPDLTALSSFLPDLENSWDLGL
ncbi:hypothetical protein BDV36DRAFT_305977 [Aspergillus pseudocaelatus]|uniref:Zn(2)-C6 fungal-type domain-containing protein n=1 Tax=Aspergillus pseudocaelatus TaxID=1825620 RepID=A0ABQ6X2D1_9EURO|nr:hypothetical protein BDV36DRAFT_305977 [Aspergillus pseudocaelatus]